MYNLKSFCAMLFGLFFWAVSLQTQAQTTATADQKTKIQDLLDAMNKLKDDDPKTIALAEKAIHLADSFYNIPRANSDGEPVYNPGYHGDGKCSRSGKKVTVTIGTAAFTSPGWLASTKYHEMVGHGNQAADDRWYNDFKGDNFNEVEAYDTESDASTIFELSDADKAELKRRRKEEHYDKLDSANKARIDSLKNAGAPYTLSLVSSNDEKSKIAFSTSPTLFVSGTVLSEERMQVTLRGTKVIEGVVVSVELNGEKTVSRTDANGHALIDFSAISAGLVSSAVAVIKSFDNNGNLINSANTNVQQGSSTIFNRPQIQSLPSNLSNNEMITIPGQNLGADAQLVFGDKVQETLSASDKEMIVFTDCKTGVQPAYVVTSNGVSESQMVNIYSLDFTLPKSSISPAEKVQASVHFESIPVGTKLIFTNKSPENIKMTIPGAQNAANECIYTVTKPNATIPVNVTGITKGNFKIALDMKFLNDNQTPK